MGNVSEARAGGRQVDYMRYLLCSAAMQQHLYRGESESAYTDNGAKDMPVPPGTPQFHPVGWGRLRVPRYDDGVDRLIREACDEACGDQQYGRGNEKDTGTQILPHHNRQTNYKDGGHCAHSRKKRVQRANRILLLLDIGCRRQAFGVIAEPNTKHGSYEQRK